MVEPPDGRTRDLQTLLQGEVNASVRYDNVATFAECTNDRCRRREVLRIKNAVFCTKEVGDVPLELDMHIYRSKLIKKVGFTCAKRHTKRTVKPRRTAASKTILAKGLNSAFLDMLIPSQTGKVEARQVRNSFPIAQELRLGAVSTLNDRNGIEVALFDFIERRSKRFGVPLVDEFVNFLRVKGKKDTIRLVKCF